jgi:predicted DNA-binding transcriptional regulator AlpA
MPPRTRAPPIHHNDLEMPIWMTVNQFISWHPMSRTTFYALVRSGQGPKVTRFSSRLVRISRDAALEWAASR